MVRQQVDVQAEIAEGIDLLDDMDVAFNLDQAAKCVKAVSDFAEVIDWRCEIPSADSPGYEGIIRMTLSENDEALHSGSYVRFNILPKERSMRMQGGYYDAFHQPTMLCETFLPLGNGTPQELESSLNSMCQILEKYHRTFVTPSIRLGI
jgi:hypothetical protein